MNEQEKVTEVLSKQISKVNEEITKTKINIADLFIKVNRTNLKAISSPMDFLPLVNDLEKMPKYLSDLQENEAKLDVLTKSKLEIDTAYSGEYIK